MTGPGLFVIVSLFTSYDLRSQMSDPYDMVMVSTTTKGNLMENINGVLDFDGADLEAEEFEALVDHEAGFDCDPYDVEAYHAEAMLAYWD